MITGRQRQLTAAFNQSITSYHLQITEMVYRKMEYKEIKSLKVCYNYINVNVNLYSASSQK